MSEASDLCRNYCRSAGFSERLEGSQVVPSNRPSPRALHLKVARLRSIDYAIFRSFFFFPRAQPSPAPSIIFRFVPLGKQGILKVTRSALCFMLFLPSTRKRTHQSARVLTPSICCLSFLLAKENISRLPLVFGSNSHPSAEGPKGIKTVVGRTSRVVYQGPRENGFPAFISHSRLRILASVGRNKEGEEEEERREQSLILFE